MEWVRIYETFTTIWKICVWVFDCNKKYFEENVKPIFKDRKVEFVKF